MVGRQVLKQLKKEDALDDEQAANPNPTDMDIGRGFEQGGSNTNRFALFLTEQDDKDQKEQAEEQVCKPNLQSDCQARPTSRRGQKKSGKNSKRKEKSGSVQKRSNRQSTTTVDSESPRKTLSMDDLNKMINDLRSRQLDCHTRNNDGLFISYLHLDYNNEFAKKFKCKPPTNEKRQVHSNLRGHWRYNLLVSQTSAIYQVALGLLSMNRIKDCAFTIVHSYYYQKLEQQFILAPQSFLDPHDNFNHLGSLMYTSQNLLIAGEYSELTSIMDQCLCLLQVAFNPLCHIVTEGIHRSVLKSGNLRLPVPTAFTSPSSKHFDYGILPYNEYYENRIIHLILFRHVLLLNRRGLSRTALEVTKVLLNLDQSDPLLSVLLIDVFSMRSEQYDFFVEFYEERTEHYRLNTIPGMCFHYALALWKLGKEKEAGSALRSAIIKFPNTFYKLLDCLSICAEYRTHNNLPRPSTDDPPILTMLTTLFLKRIYKRVWACPDVLVLLENAVKLMIDIEPPEQRHYEQYRGLMPLVFRRHMFLTLNTMNLSDDNEDQFYEQMDCLMKMCEGGLALCYPVEFDPATIFNPFPPFENICGSYKLPAESEATGIENLSNSLRSLFTSLLPTSRDNNGSMSNRRFN